MDFAQLPAHARLFPLRRNSKKPAIDKWPQLATSDPAKLDRWFNGTYKGHNVAVATGQGIVVLDVDTKGDRPGLDSLATLDARDLPQSYRVDTPSGGIHVYLAVPPDVHIPNRVDTLEGFPGIDVRGENGYVAAPPSTIDGKPYTGSGTLEDAPTWLVDLLRKPKNKVTDTGAPVTELDTPHNIAKARDYLDRHAPQAISGEAGNDTTFRVAARVRDFGVSEPVALELLADWNELNEPPWDHDDLAILTGNAFRYATSAWGGASGLADFEPYEIEEKPKKKPRMYILSMDESHKSCLTTKQDPLIEGLIDRLSSTVMYGASNVAKTFVALDLSFHIAAGIDWRGFKVAQGAVVYVAAEGGRGILKRVAALKVKHGVENVPLYIIPCPIDLLNSNADLRELLKLIQQAAEMAGKPIQLVVIDTLSRALAGGDENSSTDMGEFVRQVDLIREKAKTAALTVHHSGKDAAKGARGHSLLRAATDTEIEITKGVMTVTKQRDMEEGKPINFKLEDVEVGADPDGRQIKSATVKWLSGSEFAQIELSPDAQKMLEALEMALEESEKGFATVREWNAQYYSMWNPTRTVTSRTLFDYRKEVEASGWAKKIKHNQWVKVEVEASGGSGN